MKIDFNCWMKTFGGWDYVQLNKTLCLIGPNPNRFFCRVRKGLKLGEAFHKNKFTAYKLAIKNFNNG